MRDRCIFCPNPLDGSKEHIIPDSINGRLTSTSIICSSCNNKFGRELDPIAAETFKFLLPILKFRNARAVEYEAPDGEKYMVDPNGKILTNRFKIDFKRENGLIYFQIAGDKKNVLNWFKKRGISLDFTKPLPPTLQVHESKIIPPLRGVAEITPTPKLDLLFAKIAIEYYAFKGFDLTAIDPIVQCVAKLDGRIKNVIYTNFKQENYVCESEEISHIISISTISNHLVCYIELFNIACAVVILSDNYIGKFIAAKYRQDAVSGERLESHFEIQLDMSSILKRDGYDFPNLIKIFFEKRALRVFNSILKEQMDIIMSDLQAKIKTGELEEQKLRDEFIVQSCEVIGYLTVYHFPYIMEDQKEDTIEMVNIIHSNLFDYQYDDFCKLYQPLIGRVIHFDNGQDYVFESFYQMPFCLFSGKKVIRVYCLLVHKENKNKMYLPYKDFFDGLRPSEEHQIQSSTI